MSKSRYVFLVLLLVVLGGSIYFQTQNTYTYGASSFAGDEGTSYDDNLSHIETNFGKSNNAILLIPKDDVSEGLIYQDLLSIEYIDSINAGIYYKMITSDPFILAKRQVDFIQTIML